MVLLKDMHFFLAQCGGNAVTEERVAAQSAIVKEVFMSLQQEG